MKVPVSTQRLLVPHAKLYYALKQMDKIDDIHNLIFEEIHIDDNRLDTEDLMVNFLGEMELIQKFFRKI